MNSIPVLAVDAGATNCRALLCNETGNVLGYAHGGSANYHSVGAASAKETLTGVLVELVRQTNLRLLKSIGVPHRESEGSPAKVSEESQLHVRCAVFGLAGLDTESDRILLERVVKESLQAANIEADKVLLDNDAMMTLLGATGREAGVLLVSGTGSIACGVAADGKQARAGGWGHRVGDEGSGYYIGKQALLHIFRAYDGREEPSGITEPVLREMAMANEEELMSWVYGPNFSVEGVAALTPILASLAEAGNNKASLILHEAARELAQLAVPVIEKLGLHGKPFDLVLLGGVLQKIDLIRKDVIRQIQQTSPLARITSPRYEPICGGVLRGLTELQIDDEGVLDRLSEELAEFSKTAGQGVS